MKTGATKMKADWFFVGRTVREAAVRTYKESYVLSLGMSWNIDQRRNMERKRAEAPIPPPPK